MTLQSEVPNITSSRPREDKSVTERAPVPASARRAFSLSLGQRRLIAVAVDGVTLNISLGITLAILSGPTLAGTGDFLGRHGWTILIANAAFIFVAAASEVYAPAAVSNPRRLGIPALLAVTFAVGLSLVLGVIFPAAAGSGRWALPATTFVVITTILVVSYLRQRTLSHPAFQRRLLIVGAGPVEVEIAREIVKQLGGSYVTVGFVDNIRQPGEVIIPGSLDLDRNLAEGLGVLGGSQHLADLVQYHQVDAVVASPRLAEDPQLVQAALRCLHEGVAIVPTNGLYEQLTGRIAPHPDKRSYLTARHLARAAGASQRIAKRSFDVVSASLGLLMLLPVFPFVAAAIYIDCRGPIIYTQTRVGRYGKHFNIYKLRSMVPDAEPNGPVWAESDDPRITRVGRLLRKTHLDEFPQLINILRGEMSAVGPRPERPEFVAELAAVNPFFHTRHIAKPGMAGWGLIRQGYGSTSEDALLKLQYDLYYIKHQSIFLDTQIILQTAISSTSFKGH